MGNNCSNCDKCVVYTIRCDVCKKKYCIYCYIDIMRKYKGEWKCKYCGSLIGNV